MIASINTTFFTGGSMKSIRWLGIIFTLACLHNVMAQTDLDTLWMCRDSIVPLSANELWWKMYLSDTFPDNRGQFEMVDTGNSQDGSKYVNFDYQFNTDSVFIKGITAAGVDTIFPCAPRPGYAGFKFYWDKGAVRFYTTAQDSMFLWHKGPLPGHKVQIILAQGGECGGPINYQFFAEFKSSAVWKRESFPFPAKQGATARFPDSPFVRNGILEMRMLIYNETGNAPTSVKGSLKLDNIAFIKKSSAGVRYSGYSPKSIGDSRFFIPTASGKVTLSIYSLQGEQLFKQSVDVVAGKKYDVSQFAGKNANLPSGWIDCIQITGQGVNITRKMVR